MWLHLVFAPVFSGYIMTKKKKIIKNNYEKGLIDNITSSWE